MIGKVLLSLALLGALHQSWGYSLTKEIKIETEGIGISSSLLLEIFPKAEETVESLDSLYKSNPNPELGDVLAIFNKNFVSDMFIIKGDYIEVDAVAYQRFVLLKASSLVQVMYPGDRFKQLTAFAALQVPLYQSFGSLSSEIEARKVPIERVDSLRSVTSRTSIQQKGLIEDVTASMRSGICNALEAFIEGQLHTVVGEVFIVLGDIKTALNNPIVSSLVAGVEELVTGFVDLALDVANSTCQSVVLARKRRSLEEEFEVEVSDTRVAKRDVASGNIISGLLDILFGYIAQLINSTLKSIAAGYVTSLETTINSFLEGTVLKAVYSIIDSVVHTS